MIWEKDWWRELTFIFMEFTFYELAFWQVDFMHSDGKMEGCSGGKELCVRTRLVDECGYIISVSRQLPKFETVYI